MKGIVLCGGKGCRLRPVTLAINKHLIPIYDKPMVTFPLDTLQSIGVTNVMVVCNLLDFAPFNCLLGDSYMGMKISYKIQDQPGGTAQAISLGRNFVGPEKLFAVILGDNIFSSSHQIKLPDIDHEHAIYIKAVPNPNEFGVIDYGRLPGPTIIEKPEHPPSHDVVTGLYLYSCNVFDVIKTIKPSNRGEIEVTDLNNHLLNVGYMQILRVHGAWWDAGTFDAINDISNWRRSGGR